MVMFSSYVKLPEGNLCPVEIVSFLIQVGGPVEIVNFPTKNCDIA